MQCNFNEYTRLKVFDQHLLIVRAKEWDWIFRNAAVWVAEVEIFKAKLLSYVIIVGNVLT